MSVIVLQPLKLMRAAHSRHNCEIRFVIGSSQMDPALSFERSLRSFFSQCFSQLHAFFLTVDHERIVFAQP